MAYTEPPPDKERRYKMDEDGASINGLEEDMSNDIDDIAAILLGEDEGGEGESGDNEDHDGESDDDQEAAADEEEDEAEAGEDDEEDDDEEDEEDKEDEGEEDLKPKKNANSRIRQLVAEKKEREQRIQELESQLSNNEVRRTPEHPDPDKELAILKEQYSRIKTAREVLDSGAINPLTGEEYTAAEAQAAIAELKQDLQFKINEVQSAVVENMKQAEAARNLVETIRVPLAEMIDRYPELDADGDKFDKDLGALLQATIDTNSIMENGILTGFKQDPKKFLASFERTLIKMGTLKANARAATDKKKEKILSKTPLNNEARGGKISAEDEFMAFVDAAFDNL
jgi:hypothetical protein